MLRNFTMLKGLLLAAALLVSVAATGCGTTKPPQQPPAGQAPGAANQIEMKMTEFAFTPKEVRVKNGQPVTITLNNQGVEVHNLVVPEFNVKSASIPAGQKGAVTFTPNKKGNFKVYCSEPGHEESGMVATLVVE